MHRQISDGNPFTARKPSYRFIESRLRTHHFVFEGVIGSEMDIRKEFEQRSNGCIPLNVIRRIVPPAFNYGEFCAQFLVLGVGTGSVISFQPS